MEKIPLEGEMLRQFARFQHPDKVFNYFPGWDDPALAAIAGVSPQTLQGVRAELRAGARRAASDLLADPALAARVDRLPFRERDVVVCVGRAAPVGGRPTGDRAGGHRGAHLAQARAEAASLCYSGKRPLDP